MAGMKKTIGQLIHEEEQMQVRLEHGQRRLICCDCEKPFFMTISHWQDEALAEYDPHCDDCAAARYDRADRRSWEGA